MVIGNIHIKKRKIHHCKNLLLLEDVHIDNIQVSSIASSGEENCKYFIGYKDDNCKIKMMVKLRC